MRWTIRAGLCVVLALCALGSLRARAEDLPAGPAAAADPSKLRGEEAFKQAVTRLQSPDPRERAAAADEMGRRGYRLRREISEVLRPVVLNDSEPVVRAAAGRALGRLGVREAVPDLVRALNDASPDVRVVAAAALWRLPDPSAVEPLLKRASDPESAVREWVALALGVIGDSRAEADMIRLLQDPERAVRLAAVRSLGRIGDAVGLTPLVQYLGSGARDEEEKEEVVNSLASLKSPDKVPTLLRLLSESGADQPQRIRLIVALGQVGDAQVAAKLKPHTEPNQPAAVRAAAKEAIATLQQRAKAPEAAAKPQ